MDCVTATFVGGYLPDNRTNMYKSTTKQAMDDYLAEDEEMKEIVQRDHFRKKHWLKNYFEEESKLKLLLKNKGAPAAEKKK